MDSQVSCGRIRGQLDPHPRHAGLDLCRTGGFDPAGVLGDWVDVCFRFRAGVAPGAGGGRARRRVPALGRYGDGPARTAGRYLARCSAWRVDFGARCGDHVFSLRRSRRLGDISGTPGGNGDLARPLLVGGFGHHVASRAPSPEIALEDVGLACMRTANFRERRTREVLRIYLPRTPLNREKLARSEVASPAAAGTQNTCGSLFIVFPL
jgi:hypothetical protein